MLTAPTRRVMDTLWDRVWSAGVTNPLAVVDYIAGLFLLRAAHPDQLAAIHSAAKRGDGAFCAAAMAEVMASFSLSVPDTGIWDDTVLLARAINDVEQLTSTGVSCDTLGDCFEHILGHLGTAGDFGQFRTPSHIVKFLVDAVSPQAGETVLDPACGTGSFLIAAHDYRRPAAGSFLGDECDWTMARIATANLALHGIQTGAIRKRDALGDLAPEADVILANPPFAGTVSEGRQTTLGVASLKSELLFLELMLRRLKPGGRAGSVVPFSVLTSTASAATRLRERLVEENALTAVIELPSGVFRPYTDVRTALLLWTRARPQSTVLMMRARQDGYSLDERREPIADNDLPALLKIVRSRTPCGLPGSARQVSVSELRQTGYVLNPSRFLETTAPAVASDVSLTHALSGTVQSASRLRGILQRIEEIIQ